MRVGFELVPQRCQYSENPLLESHREVFKVDYRRSTPLIGFAAPRLQVTSQPDVAIDLCRLGASPPGKTRFRMHRTRLFGRGIGYFSRAYLAL